jgi:pimeloyl-ACP methyl ester carboxylesterase
MRIEPFAIHVPDAALEDLRERLARTRLPSETAAFGWSGGVSLEFLGDLVEHWRTRFDWRAWEARINALPGFLAEAGGLSIHVVHVRGKGPAPFPLVVTHGWPGSFLEMLEILPRLADPASHGGDAADAFDVVVPSLPGYGFSGKPRAGGVDVPRIAQMWAELMEGLGYARYGCQGGDWGAGVSTRLAMAHPERVAGIHLNYIPGSYRPHVGPGDRPLSAAEEAFLEERDRWIEEDGAYGHLQGTRPQTLAYGLNDSPAGLAAWIVEKFREWSDCGGDVLRRFDRDDLLANVTLYWLTETIASSARLYLEARRSPLHLAPGERVLPPCGVARFPLEAPSPPREWVERGYHVVRWTEMPRGGHFAAMEEPDLLAEDVRAFFRPLRSTVQPVRRL